MKRIEAKILESRKEDPASEPDQDPATWLIEAKLDQDILDWERAQVDLRSRPKSLKAVCQVQIISRFASVVSHP
jgi:hypothetical protein